METIEGSDALRKAAIIVVALGSDLATQVCEQMPDRHIRMLSSEIANLGEISPDEQAAVIADFLAASNEGAPLDLVEYSGELLQRTLGSTAGIETIDIDRSLQRLTATATKLPADAIARQLEKELPQTIAMVLTHLSAEQAAQVFGNIPDELKGQIALRMATMKGVARGVLEEVARLIERITAVPYEVRSSPGGMDHLLEVVIRAEPGVDTAILQGLAAHDTDLADELRHSLFTFEDLMELPDEALQMVLMAVETQTLALALKGADEAIKQKAFSNVSQRGAEMLEQELELMGPVKRKDVEAARRSLASSAEQLSEQGEISIRPGDEEEDEMIE